MKIDCEKCKSVFDTDAYGPILIDPLGMYNKPITICPNCIIELLKKSYSNWNFETFLQSYKKRIEIQHKACLEIQYKKTNFYLSIKKEIEKIDNKKYTNLIEIFGLIQENSEYIFLNTEALQLSPIPKSWWNWKCIKWNKDSGGPDFIFLGNKDRKMGLEITNISQNYFKIPDGKNKADNKYIQKCLENVSIKEGYFEHYLNRSIEIVSEKNKKIEKYDYCNYYYLAIVGTPSMVPWQYYFLEIFLNSPKILGKFKKIILL